MQGPIIRVIGVGNGGSNAVAQIHRHQVAGVELFALDTDVRKLKDSSAPNKLAIGGEVTGGLGAGGDPDVGARAAESSAKDIERVLSGANMVFVTAAMGGGTGTGAAPVVCRIAKELGALTVAVCTRPFKFERQRRMNTAQMGIENVTEAVDAIITIDNQKLFEQVDKHTRLTDAFALADDILRQAVQGVSDLITVPGTINVDFADVCSVLTDAGPVLMGMGEGPAESPSSDLVKRTVSSPLLENGIVGATNLLLNISMGPDTSLYQVHELADAVQAATQTDAANLIFGTVVDPDMSGRIKLTVVAASFVNVPSVRTERPAAQPAFSQQRRPAATQPQGGAGFQLPPVPPPPAGGQDDLDMPAFLRRRPQGGEGGTR
ncbi:MAG: cell division protein FtsZ [Armatimonadetes bacterium]|nr:cell division protein FtsZ [Armatimonadota bacterium]